MSKVVILGTAHPHVFGIAAVVQAMEGVELVSVYDDDADRLKAACDKLSIPGTGDLKEALAGRPALAVIGAVPSDRARLAVAAVEHGASALVDKPLALTPKALADLRKAVDRHQRQVIAFYPYRGTPLVLAARRLLDSGRIGKLVRVMSVGPHKLKPATRPAWHFSGEHNGGILIDIGSHHVDICCWMAGSAPHWVSALHANFTQPAHAGFQDFAQAQLVFPSGALGHVEVDWLNPESMKHFGDTRMWIQGTEGKIELRLGDEVTGEYWTHTEPRQPLDTTGFDSAAAWEHQLISDLIAGRPCAIPQEDVWRASAVTLAAFESAQNGGMPVVVE